MREQTKKLYEVHEYIYFAICRFSTNHNTRRLHTREAALQSLNDRIAEGRKRLNKLVESEKPTKLGEWLYSDGMRVIAENEISLTEWINRVEWE